MHYSSLSTMFIPLHCSMNQEPFEKYVCNQSSHYGKYDGVTHPSFRPKLKYPLPFSVSYICSTRYTAIQIKNCFKSTSVIKVATMKIRQFLITQMKPSHATTKLTFFTVSKDEWNTKEDTDKSLKNALHILRYAKRHLSGWSDIEQWKIKLAIIELREGIRQAVTLL